MARLQRFALASLVLLSISLAASADTVKVGGSGNCLGTAIIMGKAFMKLHPGIRVKVLPSLGSSGGIKALAAGAIDVAVIARAPKKGELGKKLVAAKYGTSPFVLVVSKKSSVTGLTTREIVELYSQKKTKWPDGTPVRLILRPKNDATTDSLKHMAPGMSKIIDKAFSRQGMIMAITDQDCLNAAERIPGALGATALCAVISEKRDLRVLSIDGVKPSVKTLADGTYKHFKSMYIVIPRKPSASASKFAGFVLSSRGSKILAQTGYLPAKVHFKAP